MHICFITSEYPKKGFSHGGIGTFVATIAKVLVEKGVKVSVVGINYKPIENLEIDKGVAVYRLKSSKIKGLKWWFNSQLINKKIKAIHKENPISIIETPELGLAFVNKLKDIVYVIRLHGGHHFFAKAEERSINWWKGFQEKRSFKKADGFIAVSNYVKEHTETYLSYFNKPVIKISSPIDLTIFKPKPKIEVKQNSLLFAGTVCRKKGIKHLIEAMPMVIEKYPNVKLNIYGRDWFFPNGTSYINYLKTEVLPSIKNWSKYIVFHGVVPYETLVYKYAEAQVCIFPSLMETQGLVAPEAMATNKTVIFSETGPGKETMTHKETGLLCNPYDLNSISNTIIWALDNKEESLNIAKKGRLFVLNNFNIDILIEKNISFYKTLIMS